MTWRLTWSWVAEHRDLFVVGYHPAERICGALMRFAATGRGDVVRDSPGVPDVFRIRVPGAIAVFRADHETSTLHVRRIYPRR